MVLARGRPHQAVKLKEIVQFVARNGPPLPGSQYLHIHATCCHVLHMFGAAAYLNKVHTDMQESNELAEDRLSADVLISALSRISNGG